MRRRGLLKGSGLEAGTMRISLLDCLLDDFPDEQNITDAGIAGAEKYLMNWDACRAALKRDVEMLLSSRPLFEESDANSLTGKSIAAYGVPRTSNNSEESVLRAIETFEPRLENISPLQSADKPADAQYSFTADFSWEGAIKELVLNVSVRDDGYVVEIYE